MARTALFSTAKFGMTFAAISCIAAVALLPFALPANAAPSYDWSTVDAVLKDAISSKVFPGCVAGIAVKGETVLLKAYGSLTYGEAPPATGKNMPLSIDTHFDLASLTKVSTTTSAVAILYQRGELDIDMPVADERLLGPAYAANGKATITPRNLLLHNAGYPPDPVPGYWQPEFDCPNTKDLHPAEQFNCVNQIYGNLMTQTLINPVGAKYVYSDLSMITLQFVVGGLVRDLGYISAPQLLPSCASAANATSGSKDDGLSRSCYYEAFVRVHIFNKLNMSSTGFLPNKDTWANTAPTWNDPVYRHEVVQGQVSDENSYALGGVAGHAGIFSTVPDMMVLMKRIMFAPAEPTDGFLNSTTVHTFTTVKNVTQSSRAYGWDTNNYQANGYRGCGNFSSVTYTHTGYTGTQFCNDPTRDVITILFTNRVYPDKTMQAGTIHTTRQLFNNAVLKVVSDE